MKYFSRAWLEGELSEEQRIAAQQRYEQHMRELLPQLPSPIAMLADEISLHDGLIRFVQVSKAAQSLKLVLLCGDLQRGYFDLDLSYSGVDIEALRTDFLASVARDRRTQVLQDEVDRSDGCFEHRMIFWPAGELAIRFKELTLTKRPRADRSVPMGGDPFAELEEE